MRNIKSKDYYIENNTYKNLLELGFHKYYDGDESYIYRFGVLGHERMTALYCKITAYADGDDIKIDVYDCNNSTYAPFYNDDCGNHEIILKKIHNNIFKEFKKLGIKKRTKKEII